METSLSQILFERTRSSSFSFKEFGQIQDPAEQLKYASQRLQFVGGGSTRAAYVLNSKLALKVAEEERGREQNKSEVEMSQTPGVQAVVPSVKRWDTKEFRWIVVELVRPLKNWHQFEQLTGILMEDFRRIILSPELKGEGWSQRLRVEPEHNAFYAGLRALVMKGLAQKDMTNIDQYGQTADGRVVLLDSGATEQYLDSFHDDWFTESASLLEGFLYLSESIRGKGFDVREFEEITDGYPEDPNVFDKLDAYIKDKGLEYIAEGTARRAYVLSSRFVLKIVKDSEKGIAQNQAERSSYFVAKPALKEILPKVFRMDKHGIWLISELVRPLKSDEEFGRLSGGLSWAEIEDHATATMKPKIKKGRYSPEALRILRGMRELQLISRPVYETFAREQWGVNTEGKLVLLDSGASEDVLETYYSPDSGGTWG